MPAWAAGVESATNARTTGQPPGMLWKDCVTKDTMSQSLLKRVKAKTVEEGDCWIWTAGLTGAGYPCIHVNRKAKSVARALAEELKTLPAGKKVSMRCRNKLCVAPDHIRVMSWQQIVSEAAKAGNHSSVLKSIRLAQSKRKASKLKPEDVQAIRSSDKRLVDLANEYGMSRQTMSDIRRGRRWAAIGGIFQGL